MPTINASGKVVLVTEADDGKVTVGIDSARTNDTGEPSFKLAYEFPAGSPVIAAYPLDTLVQFAITTTPPAVVPAEPVAPETPAEPETVEPAPEVTPEVIETPVEAPPSDPAAPVVETSVEAPAEPVVDPEPIDPAAQ